MVTRLRTSFIGTLGDLAVEQWSINLHWAVGVPPQNQVEMDLLTNELADAAATSLASSTALRDLLTLQAGVAGLATYYYGPTGPAVLQGEAEIAVGGAGSINAPFNTAMVFSLRTASPGRSGRGRVYWPAIGVDMTAGGKRVNQGSPALEFADMLTAMEAAGSEFGLTLCVYSPTKDLVTPVTTIQMGDVPDVQRRRSDNLVETYQSVTYPAP